MSRAPRKPTATEKALIARAISPLVLCSDDKKAATEFVDAAWIAVFTDYMPDSPGYNGKLAIVVWSGGIDLQSTFVFRGGNAVEVEK